MSLGQCSLGQKSTWTIFTWTKNRNTVVWTQLNVDYIKGVVKTGRVGLASGIANLAFEVVRFSLWAGGESRRVEFTMSKDQIAVLER